jgi:FkbM family methyltransferase
MRRQSQYGQDALIGDVLFKGRRGVFVDVGARDGRFISNTIYLERKLGWRGVAIEPHPDLYRRLRRTRSCVCLNVAASDIERDSLDFVKFLEEPLGNSGFLSTFREPERLASIRHAIIPVPCRPLSQLIGDIGLIHYLDIDVEGHELEVLKGINFAAVEIRIIGVEVTDHSPQQRVIDGFLANKGFTPFLQLESDRFYSAGSELPSAATLKMPP